MSGFSTQAVLLRRIAYGDHDLIITFFTRNHGKVAAIAKSAKKSSKRFAGVLEPFSVLDVVCNSGRRKGLPILQEAALIHPFSNIRTDIRKTGYASYWAEIVNEWMVENEAQPDIYHLLEQVLHQLHRGEMTGAGISILFQVRFLAYVGLSPNLTRCCACKRDIDGVPKTDLAFDLARGGPICDRCCRVSPERPVLSKGTIKLLRWVQKVELKKALRIKFSSRASREGLAFLEAFVPYHLGKIPKSLKVLRQVR